MMRAAAGMRRSPIANTPEPLPARIKRNIVRRQPARMPRLPKKILRQNGAESAPSLRVPFTLIPSGIPIRLLRRSLSWTVVTRWDEKAGLRRDAVGSQVIDALEAQEIKETGNEED